MRFFLLQSLVFSVQLVQHRVLLPDDGLEGVDLTLKLPRMSPLLHDLPADLHHNVLQL